MVETAASVDDWVPSVVTLTGLSGLKFPEDPEPEFVAINDNNLAVVTLQENNAIVLIDLATKTVTNSFSAGDVDLVNIDTEEEDLIDQTSSLTDVPREPDGVTYMGNGYFATADEGDLDGGSRGFTIFNTDGAIVYSSGSFMDQQAAAVGHYPEDRSGNKGVEPENVAFGKFGGIDYLFVNAERANLVYVYDVSDPSKPKFKQVLPTTVGPEGSKAIPSRDLLVVAGEKDDRGDKIRSAISIYKYSCADAQYPTITSKTSKKVSFLQCYLFYLFCHEPNTNKLKPILLLQSKKSGDATAPIAFAALSGLSNDPSDPKILYSVEDSKYIKSRFFTIESDKHPALLTKATQIVDSNGVFAAVAPQGEFSADDLAKLINSDNTVNIDPEGIAADGNGIFYIASEGRGNYGDAEDERPVESLNFIFKVDTAGVIHEVITLPESLNMIQERYGFEGIAYHPLGFLMVCIQRTWGSYSGPLIGAYNLVSKEWKFGVYPLDAPTSQNGGWVGLSDITFVTDTTFYVLERDNQGLLDASIKKIYSIDMAGVLASSGSYPSISKTLVKDLVADDVVGPIGGLNFEKIEGMAMNGEGWWIVNDNDGVDDNSGEIQLMNLGSI